MDTNEPSPFEISHYQQQEILHALESRGVRQPCHRCGNKAHTIHNSLTNLQLQSGAGGGMVLGGPTVPAAIIFCGNCGVISLHALGALGLLHHPAFSAASNVPS